MVISGPAAAAGLGEVRNVVHEQNERIKKLEQQISRMRLRREWGDESSQTSSSSSSTSSSSSGSSTSGSSTSGSSTSGSSKSSGSNRSDASSLVD